MIESETSTSLAQLEKHSISNERVRGLENSNERVRGLEKTLEDLPRCMVQFSLSMRILFNEQKVSASNDDTREFIEVRNNTRKNAVIYAKKILPKTEEIVANIGVFLDPFELLEFEDWKDCFDDQITDIDANVAKCNWLAHLHDKLIDNLKKDEDKAIVGIDRLKLTLEQYQKEANANDSKASMEKTKVFGLGALSLGTLVAGVTAAAVFTGGAALAVPAVSAVEIFSLLNGKKSFDNSGKYRAVAAAKKANAEVVVKAINLTKDALIPALKDFLDGLQVIQGFLTGTKVDLEKMRHHGQGVEIMYFKMMKQVAERLNKSCKMFQVKAGVMKSDLAAIEETGDKNYVDEWLEETLAQYKQDKEDPVDPSPRRIFGTSWWPSMW